MTAKPSEVRLEQVRGSYPPWVVRPILLGFVIVSISVGLRHLLRRIYRFHMWDW